ncbi:MAG: precorrin-3B C(17)-methyltransferase [Methanomicrobiales archaeon]|nr:precorrin-3B C(17)-methyltransferase [Methanomicrobiales archaeon]
MGTGPGDIFLLTEQAQRALAESEYVIGNGTYLDSLEPLLAGKKVLRSAMGREIDRAKKSIELARFHIVSLVSGGDPGIYGMASIVLEILEHQGMDIAFEILPGITAAQAAASRLGSPLSGDFAVISLSDLLTPWSVIESRLDHAFMMGVPVVFYNPRSGGRPQNLSKAFDIARKHLPDNIPVGIVRNAYRANEEVLVTTLREAGDNVERVDMHSTVIIGGGETRIWKRGSNEKAIITPRGYHRKYTY